MVIEKGKLLSKVKISGGGRCNVTNGHFVDSMRLTENYPRGNKELRGSFFNIHGPQDTMCWFSDHGVQLKTEEDGRVFPVSNTSASIVDCLLSEANRSGGMLFVDFTPDIRIDDLKHILFRHKAQFAKHKASNSFPSQFGLVKRFWRYLLEREDLDGDILWASISDNHLNSLALLLKQCPFKVAGKGQFKDEFVTAGGVPLLEDLDGDILWASISDNHLNSLALLLKQCPFKVAGKGQFKDEFVTAGGVPLLEVHIFLNVSIGKSFFTVLCGI
ncbi:hypothetical protein COCNU_scaffold006663G000010 [Cocos nucifera]|nr:hypothetical protein [Cocos nucifera]